MSFRSASVTWFGVLGILMLLATTIPAHAATADDRYEDRYMFHGKVYVKDPFVWAYTKDFSERFRMPEKWIEPELKGAFAVAFRMTTIGEQTCGYGGNAESCWKVLDCQMDIYFDNSIQLPWNFPEVIRDNIMLGLSSNRFLHFTPESRVRRYVSKDSDKPSGIMNSGGSLRHGRQSQLSSSIAYFDREFEQGIGMIGYTGPGVCPKYEGPEQVYMPFLSTENLRAFREGKIKRDDLEEVHRIEFPKSFLDRARAVYKPENKPNEETAKRLLEQFLNQAK